MHSTYACIIGDPESSENEQKWSGELKKKRVLFFFVGQIDYDQCDRLILVNCEQRSER